MEEGKNGWARIIQEEQWVDFEGVIQEQLPNWWECAEKPFFAQWRLLEAEKEEKITA